MAAINSQGGLTTTNKFSVQIVPPSGLNLNSKSLYYLCDSTNIPAMTFYTEDYKHKGYGLAEKRAVGFNLQDFSATFMIGNSGDTLDFFEDWINLIYPYKNGKELMAYPDTYWGTLILTINDSANGTVRTYTFDKIYPINTGEVTFSWSDEGTIARLPIAFTFRTYTTQSRKNN